MNRFRAFVKITIPSVALVILGMASVGHWLSAPGASPTRADIIVTLGGNAGPARLESALHLYREGYAKRILLTGFARDSGASTDHYHHWESKLLLEGGVPSEALLFDDQSKNSYEEANNTVLLMKRHQWNRALVISDPPHLRRLDMVWTPACSQHGLEYRLISTDPETWDPSQWWRERQWAKFVGMELLKLAYYTIVYEVPELVRSVG